MSSEPTRQPHKPGTAVDHPRHYNMGKIEVIDAIEAWQLGFCLGNAVKYIARAEHKGTEIQDLEKAAWYLGRQIETRKREIEERTHAGRPVQAA
jgi:hypothetical protein